MAKGEGTPIQLVAGGASEVIRARASGETPIEVSERRLIPGMKLTSYKRSPGSGPTKGTDTVEAELASKPMLKGDKRITLSATIAPAPAAQDPSAGASAAEKAAASEVRKLTLDPGKNKNLPFYYPYLSPGKLTKLSLDDQRNFSGEGVISPSVKFLGELKVAFGPDKLDLVQPIDTDAINASAFMKPVAPLFRFTGGSISMDLVKFKPQGRLDLELGPKGKPAIIGNINVTEEGGAFVAKGTLVPGGAVPGIKSAKGEVSYASDKGWSGLLEATSSSIPSSTTTVKLGFKEEKGKFRAYGEGSIHTNIRGNSNLDLKATWQGGAVMYSGGVTIEKPLPLVDKVRLDGGYTNDVLTLTGSAGITWKSINSTMVVTYRRKDGEDGKFSGKAGVDIKTEKANGHLDMNFDEAGNYWGKGSLTYQVTKDIRPTLGLELTRDRRVKMLGEVAIADITLARMWPAPAGGNLTFIKGAGVKFSIPTPVPAVTAYGEIRVSAGLGYGVGPVMLKGITFKGELYPLEDDPNIKASLKGKLSVPAYGEIHGTFGAYIGLEVALGAVGAKGGINVTPALRISGEGAVDFDAAYEGYAFTFSAEAYAKGHMLAKLDVDLVADLYAAWGVFSHTWTYKAAKIEQQIGPELKLTLGKIAYGKNGEITWPSVSQIALDPPELDPLGLIKDMMGRGKTTQR